MAPTTIYFENKKLVLTNRLIKPTNAKPLLFQNFSDKRQIMAALNAKEVKKVWLYNKKSHRLTESFYKQFPQIKAAGGIVQDDNGSILMIYKNGKWDLPKGKIDKGETTKQAAIREVKEETGLQSLYILKKLAVTYHFFESNGLFKIKKTYWYSMSTDNINHLQPQTEEGIEKVALKSKKQIKQLKKKTYKSIKCLLY